MALFTAEGIIVAIYSYLQIKELDYIKAIYGYSHNHKTPKLVMAIFASKGRSCLKAIYRSFWIVKRNVKQTPFVAFKVEANNWNV